ncbi:MAG: hypothetical protein KGZ60_05020 [Truepera sp.]|nr:hypothetical protein [Truepera sp.]
MVNGEAKGVDTATLDACIHTLRWQLVARNPVEAVDPLPEAPRDMTLWEPEQAARFLDVAREHRLYAAFYLAMSDAPSCINICINTTQQQNPCTWQGFRFTVPDGFFFGRRGRD